MYSAEVSHSFVPESNIPSGVHLSIRMSRWDRVYSPLWCAGDVGRGTNTLQTRKAAEMQGNDLGNGTTNSATQRNNHSYSPLPDYISTLNLLFDDAKKWYFSYLWIHVFYFSLISRPTDARHCVSAGLDNKLYRMHGTYIKIVQARFLVFVTFQQWTSRGGMEWEQNNCLS